MKTYDNLLTLLNIPSPSGMTEGAIDFLEARIRDLGVPCERTAKGALVAHLEGRDKSLGITLSAHIDTLGLMVRAIRDNGRLTVVPVGGYSSTAIDPAIIVLDEPTAMLDPIGRREIMRTLKRLHEEEKKTVILITHFMEEAILADRVVVLSDGKLMMEGTPREIFARTEELTELSLDVPVVTKIAHLLHDDGLTDMPVALTVEELVNAL